MKNVFGATPKSIDELTMILKLATPKTRLVAGGTDMVIQLNQMKTELDQLVALNHVVEMNQLSVEKDHITIGANVTFNELEQHEIIRNRFPALAMAASQVGSLQIRNRATLAGNIANASPCGDSIPPLLIYDAIVQVINGDGEVSDRNLMSIITGVETNSLLYDEAIIGIKLPFKEERFYSQFGKLGAKKTVTIAKINLAIGFELNESTQMIKHPRIALGAVSTTAKRFEKAEKILDNQTLSKTLADKLADEISTTISDLIEDRPSMPYKREAVIGLVADVMSHWL